MIISTQQAVLDKLKRSPLPVFFLQLGNHVSLFFDRVIKQAGLTNGADNVFILTDANFALYAGHNCIDISNYANSGRPFDTLYTHHSSNTRFFEKACFDRWFIINDLIKTNNILHFVYADCDVLLLADLKPVFDKYINGFFNGTMMFFEQGDNSITSAHTSFWNQKLLDDFCAFVNAGYANSHWFDQLLADVQSGRFYGNTNVSDMIFLDVFRTETRPDTLNLLLLAKDDIIFDFNITAAYNGCTDAFYLSKYTQTKKIVIRGNKYLGAVTGNGPVRYRQFYTLHFQGYLTKALIPVYASPQTFFNSLAGWLEYAKRRAKIIRNKIKAAITK